MPRIAPAGDVMITRGVDQIMGHPGESHASRGVGALGAAPFGAGRGQIGSHARLVRNLVDNATRYGRHRMAVRLVDESGNAVLTVDDDGLGVPEVDRTRIFERFTRLDDSRARSSGGVGIGLAWCGASQNGTAAR